MGVYDGILLDQNLTVVDWPTNTWFLAPVDEGTYQIRGNVDGLDAIAQSVRLRLNTQRYKHNINTPYYGLKTDDLPGTDREYIIPTIERRIRECFIPDLRIEGISDFNYEITNYKTDIQTSDLIITFTVNTKLGDIPIEMAI